MKTRGRTTILTPSNEPVGTDEQGLTPIKPARSIGKKLSPGNFSFPFSRPQSGNSDLVSYRAVSDSYPSLFLGDRSPAKHPPSPRLRRDRPIRPQSGQCGVLSLNP